MQIAVVDPNPAHPPLIASSVEHAEIRIAASEADFRALLAGSPPDVVILADALPWTSSLDTLALLRAAWPTAPVIMLARSADVALAVAAMKAGLADYITVERLAGLSGAIADCLTIANARHATEARYRALSELGSDYGFEGGVGEDSQLRLLWASDSVARITGYSADQLRDPAIASAITHPDDCERYAEDTKALRAGLQCETEMRIFAPDGQLR